MRQALRALLALLALAFAAVAVKAALVWRESRQGPGPLAIRWEGAVNDRNERDLGASLNACLGAPTFAEGRVWRAAQWFSGWSCAGVGEPEVILSLNHKPGREERFYCRAADGSNRVGRMLDGATELNDLELAPTWADPAQREGACWYLGQAVETLRAGQRMLVHCEAGRDRTGAVSAILGALALETAGALDDRGLAAIECDYRKSTSLREHKYGRVDHFIRGLQAGGGVASFLTTTCGLEPGAVAAAAHAFLAAGDRPRS